MEHTNHCSTQKRTISTKKLPPITSHLFLILTDVLDMMDQIYIYIILFGSLLSFFLFYQNCRRYFCLDWAYVWFIVLGWCQGVGGYLLRKIEHNLQALLPLLIILVYVIIWISASFIAFLHPPYKKDTGNALNIIDSWFAIQFIHCSQKSQ